MSRYLYIILLTCVCAACSRKDPKTPAEAAMGALADALTALSNHNYDAYVSMVDFGEELDSVQRVVFTSSIMQHQDWQEQTHGMLHSVRGVDAEFVSDSVCYALCEMCFADSTRHVISQKMVRAADGTWKMRLRN